MRAGYYAFPPVSRPRGLGVGTRCPRELMPGWVSSHSLKAQLGTTWGCQPMLLLMAPESSPARWPLCCPPPESGPLPGQSGGPSPVLRLVTGSVEGQGHCRAHCQPDNTGHLNLGPLCRVLPQCSACITPLGPPQSPVWSERDPPLFKWGK